MAHAVTTDAGAEDEAIREFAERPRIVRWLADGSTFVLTRYVVLRLLGFVYFIAFVSALIQGRALLGSDGLLPMRGYLHAVARVSGSSFAGFLRLPSLFWLDSSNAALVALTALGAAASLAVMLGVTNAGVMLVLWVLQLSLSNVGQIFWGYGWELQLLETGMIAAVICPMTSFRPFASAPPTAPVWLFRWLVVRIMLGAGLIKLRGDPCWRELTCLVTHYETQPNPSPVSWLFHQLPPAAHTAGVLFNHLVELVAPLFVFGPRWTRRVAGGLFVSFQLLLIASGNLSFLNWLTLVPALACFDDALLLRLVPRWTGLRDRVGEIVARAVASPPGKWHRRVALGYAALVLFLSIAPVMNLLSEHQAMNASFDPLHLVNTYGAFGSVNRTRDELVIEGTSDDALRDPAHAVWKEYELPCKPGDVERRPCLVSPYHYRLDWQMWFAAIPSSNGGSEDWELWIVELVDKLLHGDKTPEVLLAKDPFRASGKPPRFIRIRLYRYQFSHWGGHGWWTRRLLTTADRPGGAIYMRPVAANDPEIESYLRSYRYR